MLRVAGRPLALTLVMAPSPWAEQLLARRARNVSGTATQYARGNDSLGQQPMMHQQ
jgi:hypothetical protein